MIALAASVGNTRIGYTAVDPFEASEPCVLSLKAAYRQLHPTVAKLRLIPGQPMTALPPVANELGQFDLVVIAAHALDAQAPRAWYYLQRLLHPTSLVLFEEPAPAGQTAFRPLAAAEIEARGGATRTRRAA